MLPIDVLGPYPAEIVMSIVDYLPTDLIYFRFIVEPGKSTNEVYAEKTAATTSSLHRTQRQVQQHVPPEHGHLVQRPRDGETRP